ncbi:MAG: hypothetical protein R3F43_05680 [bacterium]
MNVPSTLKLTSQACGTRVDVSSSLTPRAWTARWRYAEACGLEWSKELVSWTGTSSPRHHPQQVRLLPVIGP